MAKSAAYKRYLFSSYNKEKEVLKYVLQELNSEQILSKSLDYHIANQDALDVFEASDGFGTDEQKMAAVIIGRRPESIKCTDTIYQSKYGRTLEVRGGGGVRKRATTKISHLTQSIPSHRTRSVARTTPSSVSSPGG